MSARSRTATSKPTTWAISASAARCLQPGWRWSESVKPIARTELCESHHIGLCVSGSARIRMREGAELLVEAGQFYEVPPGHDAWVVGDEPWITID